MANFGLHRRTRQCGELDLLFERASEQQEAGNLLSAFRLFLAAAKAGDVGAQLVLGNFYSDGTGIRRNRKQALYWYKRAYRKGYGPDPNQHCDAERPVTPMSSNLSETHICDQ